MREHEEIIRRPAEDCNAELYTILKAMPGSLLTLSNNVRKLKDIAIRTENRLKDKMHHSPPCSNELNPQTPNNRS